MVVGHVGRFNPQKNHPFIIDVFEAVHRQWPDSVLLLVGDDSCDGGKQIHHKVKSLGLENNVKFLGIRSDVSDLLQAMDVFLFPSLFEGFGIAALESQAAGLPTIVSERIPQECQITDLIQSQSLTSPPEIWAQKVIEAAHTDRVDTYDEIAAAGFDIAENAKWLQNYYLEHWKATD